MRDRCYPPTLLIAVAMVAVACAPGAGTTDDGSPSAPASRLPNIVYLYADDLGYGELGAYGQEIIATPNLDRLAAEGMLFTRHYSSSPVCAPSRGALLTGKHTGHAYIRDNKELGGWGPDEPEGQWPLAADEVTLAELLREAGYVSAAIGKWGLGGPDGEGHPNEQGFDHWYGYYCQRVAHNYYPTHLWRNRDRVPLPGNEYFDAHQRLESAPADPAAYESFAGETYAPDLMVEEALRFLDDNAERPFFLFYPTIVPHVAIQVPDDSLAQYSGLLDEEPYLGQRGYLPHPEPRAGYAAMVTRMDRDFGRILARLDDLGLAGDTLVIFSSDNGPTFNGGTDSEFFDSAPGMRGLKTQVYEGGIRVPMIARWPGRIAAGSRSDHLSAQWDVLPTVLEIVGLPAPAGIDGISFAPTLRGEGQQEEHEYLYWELGRQQAIRVGDWKLMRFADRDTGESRVELYDLAADPDESDNLAEAMPERRDELLAMVRAARVPSEVFPSPFDGR